MLYKFKMLDAVLICLEVNLLECKPMYLDIFKCTGYFGEGERRGEVNTK